MEKIDISIILPVFNEEKTIGHVIRKLLLLSVQKEIIVINDGSTDSTPNILKEFRGNNSLKILEHKKNRGKGAAIRTGIKEAQGEFLIIQDADLEYDPQEYPKLIAPIIDGKADAVYGSRFLGEGPHRVHLFWHYVGNRFLTILSNMFTNLNLTDMETCYKVFKTDIIKKIELKEKGFGIEPEITAKISKAKCRVYEVGISYFGRSYNEGKKINWKDGFKAIYCIIKYGVLPK